MKLKSLALACVLAWAFSALLSANHRWGKYHWARTTDSVDSVNLTLGNNVDSTWAGWLNQASYDWSQSAVLYTEVVRGQAATPDCVPATGKVEVCNALYGNNNWLGIAQIWVSGSHITRGSVKLNDTYHNQAPYNTDGWRDLVMCQEVGHIFGLDHQDENFGNGNLGTCMDYTSNPEGPPSNLQPNTHDYYMLDQVIYTHVDGGGSGGCKGPAWKCSGAQQPAPPAFDMSLPNQAQWGRLVATSRDGGQSVFVQDFGAGHRVYTHVTWTLDMAAQLAEP